MTLFIRFARLLTRGKPYALMALLLAIAAPSAAHEGHDHSQPPAQLSTGLKPRLALQTELYQLVAISTDGDLRIFLDRTEDNAPVTDAALSLTIGDKMLEARPQPDGSYAVDSRPLTEPGEYEIVASITGGAGDDLLIGSIDVPVPVGAAMLVQGGERNWSLASIPPWLAGTGLFLAGVLLGASLRGRRPVGPLAAILAMGMAAFAQVSESAAHEGHDHGPAAEQGQVAVSPAVSGDVPQRLQDGSLFVPKPTQRLLEIRTAAVEIRSVSPAIRLIGRVVADPAHSGYVQSINGGRIFPPPAGLPRLGQRVKKGEVLTEIEPPLATGDYASLAERLSEIEQQIALVEAKIERFQKLLDSSAVARAQLDDAKVELDGLQRRRVALRSTQREREVLRAPVDGVIATANAIPGQVVEARDVLFHVLDPSRLWVEALAFDPRNAEGISAGHAVLEDGTTVPLEFVGKGSVLQQHSAQLQFAITGHSELAVGQPVTVMVQRQAEVKGRLLPKEAVVRGANGEWLVFEHAEPERFIPRPVRVEQVDGKTMLALSGIEERARVVVHAAEMLNQIR